jgi:hypothetical protein
LLQWDVLVFLSLLTIFQGSLNQIGLIFIKK